MSRNNTRTFDYNLRMKDAGAISADAAAQVGGADKILDLGSGYVEALVQIEASVIVVNDGDELYLLKLQLSNSATFSSTIICAAALVLGDSSVTGSSADSTLGRYELFFSNEHNGALYRYARMYTDVLGTTPSINYTANMFKD